MQEIPKLTRPSQKPTAVRLWVNALERVIPRSPPLADEGGLLRRVSPSAFGRAPKGATAVKPWGSTDEELVGLVRTKDKEQYRELVVRYQMRLLRYASFLINDAESAQDVVQQAFIKAFVNLQGFDIKKKFSSWIYRIVHNEAINYLKKKKKEVLADSLLLENIADSSPNNFEEIIVKKDKQQILLSSLEVLPIDYRAPLTLFYFEEKSYDEIGEILRLPVGTVGTRINRGKKYLKKLYLSKGGKHYE